MPNTAYRICPFCEATCGLALTVEGRTVTAVRGDEADVFSQGFICPKGAALPQLDADPDRVRQPLLRRNGDFVPVSWNDACAEIDRRLVPILTAHGRDAVAVYLGNPSTHTFGLGPYVQVFVRALRTKNVYSASTVDQIPKQLAAGLMFGSYSTVAVPDIERCDFLLMLGANPMDSNGSLWTVPDFPGRLRALQQRGGRCVVIDPRRTRTAEVADEHLFIRPGTDALLLFAMAHTLFAENRVRLGRLAGHVSGVEAVQAAVAPFAPETVASRCGVPAPVIRGLARTLATTERAALYGRIGTCLSEFGTLASWLIDVCNVLTGHLDTPGGMMFPMAAAFAANTAGTPGVGRGIRVGRRHSRVRGAPEVMGEFPVVCLAEEIETPGDGQVRALITVAGNPVLSTPNGGRLSRALSSLEFMVSCDIYRNETTRHADLILPGLSPLEQSHFDPIFPQFGYRNAVRYSRPVFAVPADRPGEWENLLRLTAIISGQGAGAATAVLDDFVAMNQLEAAVANPQSPVHGRDPGELFAALGGRRGPDRLLDLALRSGPYGDGFGTHPDGLSLAKLEAEPHGIDLGPLRERIPEVLRTPSGKIELAPSVILDDVARARAALDQPPAGDLLLVGRRHLRSNNSWLHNLPILTGGRPRCTLLVHPDDAERLGLRNGAMARVTTSVGSIDAPVEVSATMMPGVVSLPHGWGHDEPGVQLAVAARQPGVNSNQLADNFSLDPVSGNARLNGIPVRVGPVA